MTTEEVGEVRKKLLARVHILKKEAGLDDDIIKNEIKNKGGVSAQTIHDVEVILGIADGD